MCSRDAATCARELLEDWGLVSADVDAWLRGVRGLVPPNPVAEIKDRAYALAEAAIEEEVLGRSAALAEALGLDPDLVDTALTYALTGRPADLEAAAAAAAAATTAKIQAVDNPPAPVYNGGVQVYGQPLPVWSDNVFASDFNTHLVSVDPSGGGGGGPGQGRSATGIVEVSIVGGEAKTAAIVIRGLEATFDDFEAVARALRKRARVGGPDGGLLDAFLVENTAAGPALAATLRRSIADLADLLDLQPLPTDRERRPPGTSKRTTPPGVVLFTPHAGGKSARRRLAYAYFEDRRVYLDRRLVPGCLSASGSGPTQRTVELVNALQAGLRQDVGAGPVALDLADALVQAILYAEASGLIELPPTSAGTGAPSSESDAGLRRREPEEVARALRDLAAKAEQPLAVFGAEDRRLLLKAARLLAPSPSPSSPFAGSKA